MRGAFFGFGMVTSALIGLALSFYLLSYEGPIYFHMLYADYPNPNGHGLKGVIVPLSQLLFHSSIALVTLRASFVFWRKLRTLDS